MDRFGGTFGAHDDAEPYGQDPPEDPEPPAPEGPPSPVGQDERRMQVRAYNHWASLLGDTSFPAIDALQPERLDDFGPYGVLLDFGGGIDDPEIRFMGSALAQECGADTRIRRLSDVPGRSLLSRITDHYLQIMANQAPIGFEAEFVNQRGAAVLYRGILLPWSSDGETIDFIFGVINWKEMADAATADALLSAIDAALAAPAAPHEGEDTMDRSLDLSGFAEDDGIEPFATGEPADAAVPPLPAPAFGTAPRADDAPFELVDELDGEEEDEDPGASTEWGAGFSGFGDDDTIYSVDYGAQGLEEGESDEGEVDGVVDPLADQSASLGLAALVSRGNRAKQSVALPGLSAASVPASRLAVPQGYEPEPTPAAAPAPMQHPVEADREPFASEQVFALDPAFAVDPESGLDPADDGFALPGDDAAGLYDCLAAARELAQTARSSEDRGRKALYQAVGRAYDFSLEAAANPEDFGELLAENGLSVQDRAPMTPIVKLVFGVDYDKTRLTEYATVLGYAHRTAVARGTLDRVLAEAEGGLKGVVQAERRARKAGDGNAAEAGAGVRNALARKLRKLAPGAFADLAGDGAEFALVMVRRMPSGELAVLGEVPEDIALVERAARRLLA